VGDANTADTSLVANGAQQISGASGAHHTRSGSSPHGNDRLRLLLPLLLWLPLLWLLLPLRLLLPRLRLLLLPLLWLLLPLRLLPRLLLLLLPLGRGRRLPLVLLRKARLALGAGQVTRDGGESVRDGRIPLEEAGRGGGRACRPATQPRLSRVVGLHGSDAARHKRRQDLIACDRRPRRARRSRGHIHLKGSACLHCLDLGAVLGVLEVERALHSG